MQRPYPLPSDPTQQSVEKFLRNGISRSTFLFPLFDTLVSQLIHILN